MLNIKQIPTGDIQENCYLIYNDQSMIIVDPGDEPEKIKATIQSLHAQPKAILLTHTHYDHIGAVDNIRDYYNIPVYVSPIEQSWLHTPEWNLSGLSRHDDIDDIIVRPAEFEFTNYDTYNIGDMSFKVVPTPGHSPGSVSFIFDDFVICGDALFKGSVGRTDLPFGDSDTLLTSIKKELFTLPDDLTAYPGHGQETTIGREKRENPFFN